MILDLRLILSLLFIWLDSQYNIELLTYAFEGDVVKAPILISSFIDICFTLSLLSLVSKRLDLTFKVISNFLFDNCLQVVFSIDKIKINNYLIPIGQAYKNNVNKLYSK